MAKTLYAYAVVLTALLAIACFITGAVVGLGSLCALSAMVIIATMCAGEFVQVKMR